MEEAGFELSEFLGLTGRFSNPPLQFGQTFSKTSSAHSLQKVHSYEQIIASVESGARSLLQFSQFGLITSMGNRVSALLKINILLFCKVSRSIQH